MKRNILLKFIAVNLLLLIAIILPFIPGPSNKFAIGLSAFFQAIGFFGWVLVPVGLAWTVLQTRKWGNVANELLNRKLLFYGVLISAIIITALCMFLAIATFMISDVYTSAFLLILIAGSFYLAVKEIKKIKNPAAGISVLPLYLVSIPLLSFISRPLIVEPISDFSRDFAIKRSEALINSIEKYKNTTGIYPDSIRELEAAGRYKTPGPLIMGIGEFRYNKINNHYSLSFSQWLECGSTEEIVLYDKANIRNKLEGKYAAYNYKFDLCRIKGAFAVRDTKHDNWRSFLVD